MKVKRDSWHCKISNWGNRFPNQVSDNLCLYFWRMIFKICFVAFYIIALTALGYLFCTDFAFRFIWMVILYCGFSIFVSWFAIHYLRFKLGKSPEIPGGNIVIEYIKAKKAKICPLIEYTD